MKKRSNYTTLQKQILAKHGIVLIRMYAPNVNAQIKARKASLKKALQEMELKHSAYSKIALLYWARTDVSTIHKLYHIKNNVL